MLHLLVIHKVTTVCYGNHQEDNGGVGGGGLISDVQTQTRLEGRDTNVGFNEAPRSV